MKQKTVLLAKINTPVVSNVLLRKRLFELIDAYPERPITWISSPAGSGKTTLVSSYISNKKIPSIFYQVDETDSDIANFFYYMGEAVKGLSPRQKPLPLLTPEYLPNIPVFVKRYFEKLYDLISSKSLKNRKFTIVFDNFQDVTLGHEFHKILNNGLSLLHPEVKVILISRTEPPPAFIRLQASEKINYVGWDEIKFTIDEYHGTISNKGIKNITPEITRQLHTKTNGWVAGLLLLLGNTKTENVDLDFSGKLNHQNHQEIFNYFISEVFDKNDKETKGFLLKTAYLPKFTASIAEKLTGIKDTEHILSNLCGRNYFIVKQHGADPFYWYHPLFREFLLSRAKYYFTDEQIIDLKKNTALLLESGGHIEYAGMLLEDVREWDSLTALIIRNAGAYISQGRGNIVDNWIIKIPLELSENNAWLLFWSGICARFSDPDKSITYLEKAFNIFKSQKDKTGLFLCWINIVDTITLRLGDMHLLDDYINSIGEILGINQIIKSPELDIQVSICMFVCMFYRQPGHPDLDKWMKRALSLLEKEMDVKYQALTIIFVSIYLLLIGDFFQFEILMNRSRKLIKNNKLSPFEMIRLKINEAFYFSLIGSENDCLSIVSEGLSISQNTGINLLDHQFLSYGVFTAISCGNFKKVEELLEKMKLFVDDVGVFEKAIHHFVISWYSLVLGNTSRSLFHQETALKMACESGFLFHEAIGYFGMAQIFYAMDKHQEAMRHLQKCRQLNMITKSSLIEYMCLLFETFYMFQKNEEDVNGFGSLQKAMVLGREKEYFNYLGFWPFMISKLCVKALSAGIEVEYVKDLIRKRNLISDISPLRIENWPWKLKVFILGKFRLEKDEKVIEFSGKVQRKPLDLLKALISFGGREVPMSLLIDSLWPDADADTANTAFDTTLHRLRKLITDTNIIKLNAGKLSLDEKSCYLDVWAFEEILQDIDSYFCEHHPEKCNNLIDKAFKLFSKYHLAEEDGNLYILSMLEKLRDKFVCLILKYGNYLERKNKLNKAIEYYKKGIEIDETAEELYQGLMLCYYKLGCETEAVKLYNRLRSVLNRVLNINPSTKTDKIYSSLRK